ncbi:MAG: ATP-binding protein [Brevundimonas sp.]|uniref:sensor histidine kinase n=1 Tax=Brevundimonas sp. TaxID=1871086 RepID=UPI00273522D1|nr:ATP-binding protein [Brevundimonas sp.]MBX9616471.1 PAS domain-containing protein [Caulobacteraceae bacterium]MDP3403131.1 ATP-binding protein [Brevundimonas sp.]
MPFDESPSPVAPLATSRLWTAGTSGGIAVIIMLVLAAMRPDMAPWLGGGAAVVGIVTWLGSRRPPPRGDGARPPEDVFGTISPPQNAALLDSVFEALDDPVMIVSGGEADDIAGRRIVLANRAARELLRIQREGALLVSAMRDPNVLEAVDEALFGGVGRTTDYNAGGARPRHWKAWVRPLPAPERTPMALLGLRDETDVRRMELMRVDFLANASHELRTPLASLSGFIETLKGHARDDPKARDRFLDIMAAQAERMSRLVADLLSLSRIELNEHIPPSGHVDLARAASDVVDAISVLSQEKGVTVLLNVEPGGANITGDRDEILQVIQNLTDNGIKYSAVGGTVELTLRSGLEVEAAAGARLQGATRLSLLTPDREIGARYVSVAVRDYGPGMAREHLPRLTERFYRVEGQKSGERPGTGLGLAIVKHIVNRHRGGMTVESAPGDGSVFSVYFPMRNEPAPENPGH